MIRNPDWLLTQYVRRSCAGDLIKKETISELGGIFIRALALGNLFVRLPATGRDFDHRLAFVSGHN